jgi:hypothetical protein
MTIGTIVFLCFAIAIMIAIVGLPMLADLYSRRWAAHLCGDEQELRRTRRVLWRVIEHLPNWYRSIAHSWARTLYQALYSDWVEKKYGPIHRLSAFPKAGNKYR